MTITELRRAHTPAEPVQDTAEYKHYACQCGYVAVAGWAYGSDVDDERVDHERTVIAQEFYEVYGDA